MVVDTMAVGCQLVNYYLPGSSPKADKFVHKLLRMNILTYNYFRWNILRGNVFAGPVFSTFCRHLGEGEGITNW